MSYPDDENAERTERELRRRILSLALRNVKMPFDDAAANESESASEAKKVFLATDNELPILRLMQNVSYIPVRIAVLGDPSIGRTTTIMKHLRSYPIEEPFRDESVELMLPSVDRFGNSIYTTVEKGPGKWDFSVTIVDPPSHDPSSQIAALRGTDAVVIGFACDNIASIRSIASTWVPFVRKWLGHSIPISVVGFKADRTAEGVSGTTIFETLFCVGIRSFDLCLPPYKKSFWRPWTPTDCPLPDGTWI
jgi:hypothetical protein